MTIYQTVTIVIAVVALVIGLYAIVRNYAIDSMGELRYMIKCAKERREHIPEDNTKWVMICDEEIKSLEKKLTNHWGTKLAAKHKSVFDIIPTPDEDPDGTLIKRILRGK